MTQMDPIIVARFWSRVQIPTPRPNYNPCWLWQGALDKYGYGQFKTVAGTSPLKTHRIAYAVCKGEIPSGMHVLHSCNNPQCCNPAHLRVGTHAENMADMKAAGHVWRGGPNRKVLVRT